MPSTDLAVVHDGYPEERGVVPLINIDHEHARLDNFRNFVHNVLDESKGHYGSMPGVERKFLMQPGAELIYRALESRPHYDILTEKIDWDTSFCFFVVKCQVVHALSGVVMGEDFGTCSSSEFATNCRYGTSRAHTEGADPFYDCPVHGRLPGRIFRVKGATQMSCAAKTAQGLDRTLQNVLAKAKKRAMVAAIRTVGCVSEMFSQDSDLMSGSDDADELPPKGTAAPKPMFKPAASKPTPTTKGLVVEMRDDGTYMIQCPTHGFVKGRPWNERSANPIVKCTKNDAGRGEDARWCSFSAPMPTGVEEDSGEDGAAPPPPSSAPAEGFPWKSLFLELKKSYPRVDGETMRLILGVPAPERVTFARIDEWLENDEARSLGELFKAANELLPPEEGAVEAEPEEEQAALPF